MISKFVLVAIDAYIWIGPVSLYQPSTDGYYSSIFGFYMHIRRMSKLGAEDISVEDLHKRWHLTLISDGGTSTISAKNSNYWGTYSKKKDYQKFLFKKFNLFLQ